MGFRNAYINQLREIKNNILRMGSLVEKAVYDSIQALMNLDADKASQVIAGDDIIDQLYADVEEKCIILLATQQPIAKYLRMVFSDIKILVNLERMADYAVDISRVTIELSEQNVDIKAFSYVPEMADKVQQIIKNGLDSYTKGSIEKAGETSSLDDEVDKLFSTSYQRLIESMEYDLNSVVRSLFVGRYLERIADHAINIEEEVIFIVTGEREDLN